MRRYRLDDRRELVRMKTNRGRGRRRHIFCREMLPRTTPAAKLRKPKRGERSSSLRTLAGPVRSSRRQLALLDASKCKFLWLATRQSSFGYPGCRRSFGMAYRIHSTLVLCPVLYGLFSECKDDSELRQKQYFAVKQ